MKVVFLSNYLNHHQLPFCQEMHKRLGEDFCFVATISVPEHRLALGYADMNRAYPFVIRTYEDQEQENKAYKVTMDADVAIIGSAPQSFVQGRLRKNKLTFLYSERLYKNKNQWWKLPINMLRLYKLFGRHKSMYLLCASAYTAGDFAKARVFLNKTYKWGYFPEVKRYDDTALIEHKRPATLLWAGRLIDWKHPESVLEMAKKLQQEGYSFQVHMLGTGELEDGLKQKIREYGLEEKVLLPGPVSPERVREYMEKAAIYLFTSDRNEGWGAVLNEAMNSGCAVVASDAIGSVRFLLDNGQNGMIYESGNDEALFNKVKGLLDDPEKCAQIGRNAYRTMTETWNAEQAADRLLKLCGSLLAGQVYPQLFDDGPCSKAEILRNEHA